MDERDPPPVRLGNDLVTEDGSTASRTELLDVRAAEPAGEHVNELSATLRLGDVRELRLSCSVEHDGAHQLVRANSELDRA